ncbi:MAG: TRAP transporter large permease subunit [Hyphomicrobiales bacterium]|nr:TRAP transporter large permease subunit [Hyphomicrobiales bacterium]
MIEILFPALLILLLLGVPVAFALGLASVAALYLASGIPLIILPQKLFNGLNSFPFLAIPLFPLAGNIMAEAQISERLVKLPVSFWGGFRADLRKCRQERRPFSVRFPAPPRQRHPLSDRS